MLRDFSLRDFGASLNTVEGYTNESSSGKIGLCETANKQKCTHLGMFLASGLVSYTHTFASPTNTTFNVKIECEDIKGATSKVSANTNIYFVGKSYYGVVESDGSPFAVTEDLIKGLSKKEVKIKKALTYKNINATFGRIVYAYPKNLPSGGALTSIKDQGTGWSVFDSYTSQEITIDGITYLCYYMIDAGGFDGVTMIFA